MKNKTKWFASIATLSVCLFFGLCVLAIGVYAATTARFTASGEISFIAHGCDVNITGYITGHADSAEGPIVETHVELPETQITSSDGEATGSIPLGNRFFCDLGNTIGANDITICLTIENQSMFNVEAKVESPVVSNANVLVAEDSTLVVMDKTGGTKATQTITFTLSLKKNTSDFSANSIGLNISFSKSNLTSSYVKQGVRLKSFDPAYSSKVRTALGNAYCYDGDTIEYGTTYKNYAERFKYVELGKEKATGEYLRWLVIGRDNAGVVTALTDEDKAIMEKGGLLSGVKYYLLSETALYTENATNYGISFQNTYNKTEYKNSYGEKANDYATSNIRAYLKGEDVQISYVDSSGTYTPSGTVVNFYDTYTFTDADLARIEGRTLNELYETDNIGFSWDTVDYFDVSLTVPNSVTGTTADKFWLLSESELMTVFAEDVANDGCYENIDTYMVGRTLVQNSSAVALWWLRSPYSLFDDFTRCLDFNGCVRNTDDYYNYVGVRAAFRLA